MSCTEYSVTLRQATDADSSLVYAIKKAAMKGYIERVWGEWEERFQQGYHEKHYEPSETRILVAEGRDIGFLVVHDCPEYSNLELMCILPEYQNRGIGGRVIGEMLGEAGRNGRRVRLHVLKINPAVGLYKRLEFRIIGELDKHYVMEWGEAR